MSVTRISRARAIVFAFLAFFAFSGVAYAQMPSNAAPDKWAKWQGKVEPLPPAVPPPGLTPSATPNAEVSTPPSAPVAPKPVAPKPALKPEESYVSSLTGFYVGVIPRFQWAPYASFGAELQAMGMAAPTDTLGIGLKITGALMGGKESMRADASAMLAFKVALASRFMLDFGVGPVLFLQNTDTGRLIIGQNVASPNSPNSYGQVNGRAEIGATIPITSSLQLMLTALRADFAVSNTVFAGAVHKLEGDNFFAYSLLGFQGYFH